MKVIQTVATITEYGNLLVTIKLPLLAGNYQVVIVIDEHQASANERSNLLFSAHDVGLVDENFTFRREDLYNDWGR